MFFIISTIKIFNRTTSYNLPTRNVLNPPRRNSAFPFYLVWQHVGWLWQIIMVESEHLPSSGFFIAVVILGCFCIIFGILGNLAVIAYNLFMIHTKTPTSSFVASLAFADIIVCSVSFPVWIGEFMQILLGNEGNQKLFCQIGTSSYGTGISLSIYNILAITVDRFLFISQPLKYPIIMTWLRTYVALIAIWLSAIIHAITLAFNTEETSKRLYCEVDLFVCYFGGVIYFLIPFIALFALNYKIFKVARNQRRRITVNFVPSSLSNMPCSAAPNLNVSRRGITQQLRIIKTFAIVIGVFILCTIPHVLIKTIEAFGCAFNCTPTSLHIVTGLLLGANSVFNPFIYGVRHKEYRNAFAQLFANVRLGTWIQWIYLETLAAWRFI